MCRNRRRCLQCQLSVLMRRRVSKNHQLHCGDWLYLSSTSRVPTNVLLRPWCPSVNVSGETAHYAVDYGRASFSTTCRSYSTFSLKPPVFMPASGVSSVSIARLHIANFHSQAKILDQGGWFPMPTQRCVGVTRHADHPAQIMRTPCPQSKLRW